MKVFAIFVIFLLSVHVAMAQSINTSNITIPRITIRIPNITINLTRGSNTTFLNQTRIKDILEVFSQNVTDILMERANKAVGYLLNRVLENIGKTVTESIPNMIEIMVRGKTEDSI